MVPGLSAAAAAKIRPHFVIGEFAVAVLVELLQGGGGVGDFIAGDFVVVIGVERGKDGVHHAGSPPSIPPTAAPASPSAAPFLFIASGSRLLRARHGAEFEGGRDGGRDGGR